MAVTISAVRTLWALLLAATAAVAATGGLSSHGVLQFDASGWYRNHENPDSATAFAAMNLLTLNFKTDISGYAKVEGLLDLYQAYGEYASMVRSAASDHALLSEGGGAPILADLRTLYGSFYLHGADVVFGRRIVNYGKAILLSPLDVFSSVNLIELSFKRSGEDIVMASIPIGDVSGIDVVSGLPLKEKDNVSSMRGFTTVGGWDISAAGIYRHRSREGIAGVAVKGDLVAGVTAELSAGYNRSFRQWRFEAMAGTDYSVRKMWFFVAEYLYRKGGETHPIYDCHNLFLTVRYAIDDLKSVSIVILGALPRENHLATLQYSWSMLQNVNTVFFARYYRIEQLRHLLPQAESGIRVSLFF